MNERTEKVVAVKSGHRDMEDGRSLFFLFTARQVEEVLSGVVMRALPFAPASLMGMAQWRGHLLPVVDLEKQLSLPDDEHREDSRFLVVRTGLPEHAENREIMRCIVRLSARIQPIDVSDSATLVRSEAIGVDASQVRAVFQQDDATYIFPDLVSILAGDVGL